ncbi:hypothetical protein FQN57_002751 [Myotisia sp. PD_48]|nr:hypothetical protein FQN57_002751 [Myotisia sp. PD_48]
MDAVRDQARDGRGSSQKTMLSRALQKANTAVLLDNATNYAGAIEAYTDACGLLSQVMHRAGGNDEKHKLDDIRNTYTIRINELRRLGSDQRDEKALPQRPLSSNGSSLSHGVPTPRRIIEEHHHHNLNNNHNNHGGLDDNDDDFNYLYGHHHNQNINNNIPSHHHHDHDHDHSHDDHDDGTDKDIYVIGTATATRILNKPHNNHTSQEPNLLPASYIPPRQQSLLPSSLNDESRYYRSSLQYGQSDNSTAHHAVHQSPDKTNETTSWLDTIDESGASSASSIRSASSSLYLRQKGDFHATHGTEAEFDAALDAAVEAAYDQGLEIVHNDNNLTDDEVLTNVRRNVELAKQKVREAQMEADAASVREREMRRIHEEALHGDFSALDTNYEDHEAEEEERILEEMMDDFEFDLQSKSALPRQSGSSGYSSRTWGSSMTSTRGISLSTLPEEDDYITFPSKVLSTSFPPHPPPQPPPTTAPPPLPVQSLPAAPPPTSSPPPTPGAGATGPSTVRARRLSGRPNDLVIEIGPKSSPMAAAAAAAAEASRPLPPSMLLAHPSPQGPLPAPPKPNQPQAKRSGELKLETALPVRPTLQSHSTAPAELGVLDTPAATSFPHIPSQDPIDFDKPLPSPTHVLRKLPSAPDSLLQESLISSSASITGKAPWNNSPAIIGGFGLEGSLKSQSLPALAPTALHLFDHNIHSPISPGSPNPDARDAPIPLEPCPQSFLLRPFWLMRCLYQTIAHPRGGYLTTKLFIPKDVWRVKNVKIKALEEKVSNCDLLTAALLNLAKVDTNDADAVLEEMQALEPILDQVQALWSRKLGNEVGVSGSMALFNKMSPPEEASPSNDPSKASGGSKSYLSSWRKLRSKSSGANISQSANKESGRDTLSMKSLPMTEAPTFRLNKHTVSQIKCTGPHATYMSALARLFDAAQVIDQIAHQVEDPGLRHSSQTLVGLELSTRHAAEFFGFYACRFALNDIGLMIDKFVKRGSEYVLV